MQVDRERSQLISQTFKELNTQYNNYHRRGTQSSPPLSVNRVKVTFREEPGEGSGVARSFYTALSEALLSHDKLPNLESCQVSEICLSNYHGLQKFFTRANVRLK